MYKSFLVKYGEIGVKGKNRYIFENMLMEQIRHALKTSAITSMRPEASRLS